MKRALFILALGVIGTTAEAAEPEAKASAAPASIGRLFFTPSERAQLDIARMQRKPAALAATASAEPVEAPPTTQVVTYGGIVRRSDGKSMLWINNRLVDEKDALSGLSLKGKVRSDGAVTLHVPQTGGSIDVKVGQSVELQTGRVAETRKPPPETKPAPTADDAKPVAPEPAATPTTSTPPPTSVPGGKPAPEPAEKKSASGPGVGLKMDLGGRTLEPAESQRLGGGAK